MTRWILPILALSGATFAGWTSLRDTAPSAPASVQEPPPPAFPSIVAGSGLVEPWGEAIAIGTPVGGIVSAVLVKPGDAVVARAPLFRLDDRSQVAAVGQAESRLALARERLRRLEAGTRRELIPPAEARLARALNDKADAQEQLTRTRTAVEAGAATADELSRRTYALAATDTRVAEARADLELLRAGTWAADLAVARAEVANAEADLKASQTELDRLTILAPIAASVLRVDVRPGEYALSGGPSLITLGDLTTLCVRVDVDEQDAWRLQDGATGRASVRGNPGRTFTLQWVRTEPYVRPKKSLTGDSSERIDTRVLQAIYRIKDAQGLHVGQQLDVQLDAR